MSVRGFILQVLLLCPQDFEAPSGAVPFRKERELLQGFCQRVREIDPDVLTGWNAIDFDLKVLDRMARVWRACVPVRWNGAGDP